MDVCEMRSMFYPQGVSIVYGHEHRRCDMDRFYTVQTLYAAVSPRAFRDTHGAGQSERDHSRKHCARRSVAFFPHVHRHRKRVMARG
jgi:hypothetical protein